MTNLENRLPFACRGCHLSLLSNLADDALWLSIARSSNREQPRTYLIRVAPVLDHKELPYRYTSDAEQLTLSTCRGEATFRFDREHRLRVRVQGISLRLTGAMMLFENATQTEDGALEIGYAMIGKLLLVPVSGAMYTDATWSPEKSRSEDFQIELIPSAETGCAEMAITEYYANGPRNVPFGPMDDCATDFPIFCKRFGLLRGRAQQDAARVIWNNSLGPCGELSQEAVCRSRRDDPRVYGWEQIVQAIACCGEPRVACSLLTHLPCDAAGLPVARMDDINLVFAPVAPPLLGLALSMLLSVPAVEWGPELTMLYETAIKALLWWGEYRDRTHSGWPQAYGTDELPEAEPRLAGLEPPFRSPGLTALLVSLAEGCARIAPMVGRAEEAARWDQMADDWTALCLSDMAENGIGVSSLWGGRVPLRGLNALLPVLLGRRLPTAMVETLAAQFSEALLTDDSPQSSPLADVRPLLAAIGFEQAGRPDISRRIALACSPHYEQALYRDDALQAAVFLILRRWLPIDEEGEY